MSSKRLVPTDTIGGEQSSGKSRRASIAEGASAAATVERKQSVVKRKGSAEKIVIQGGGHYHR
jgi:hypothetical protein